MKKLLIFHICKSTDMEMSTMQHWCYGKELRCNSWGLMQKQEKILKQFMTLNTSLQLFTKIKIQTHLFIV